MIWEAIKVKSDSVCFDYSRQGKYDWLTQSAPSFDGLGKNPAFDVFYFWEVSKSPGLVMTGESFLSGPPANTGDPQTLGPDITMSVSADQTSVNSGGHYAPYASSFLNKVVFPRFSAPSLG